MQDSILTFLAELHPETDFQSSSDFVMDGLLDSLDLVSLVAQLEREFNVFIDALDIIPENFSSVVAIEALVHKSRTTA